LGVSYCIHKKYFLFGNLFYKYGFSEIENKEIANVRNIQGVITDHLSLKQKYPYKYSSNSSSLLLRSKTNNINMGFQFGVLYQL
jgi:hypothetical protein